MMYTVDAFPGRTFISKGKEFTYFGGTSYLGLQTNTAFQQLYIKNIAKYGTGYSASRASNVRFRVYEEAENQMAASFGCEACFTVSSGYLASQLAAQYFKQQGYALFYAPETHVALHSGNCQNEADYDVLTRKITHYLNTHSDRSAVLLLDTVDFFGRNYPDFLWLKKLPLYRIVIVADDSHGFGIVGASGSSSFHRLSKLHPEELVVCGSLGKGFGIQAGAVAGTLSRVTQLKNAAMFAASSPAVPAAMATYLEAGKIYQQQLKKLRKHIAHFKSLLTHPDRFYSMPEHPAFTFTDDGLTSYLEAQGVVITNFPYPNDSGDKINRIVLSAHHTEEDIEGLCRHINDFERIK
ncbi:aminotransferase class I/II-fold pyridoxal phosphate-dependent enzyme [Flavobacteriaceae bacterium M23B6Z8]